MKNQPKRIIIAGGRDFNDYDRLCKLMDKVKSKVDIECIVCGKARGADTLGERWALENAIKVKYFIPDWGGLGKKAGHVRNRDMGDYANENSNGVLIAWWDEVSRGTKGMIDYGTKIGLDVRVYKY